MYILREIWSQFQSTYLGTSVYCVMIILLQCVRLLVLMFVWIISCLWKQTNHSVKYKKETTIFYIKNFTKDYPYCQLLIILLWELFCMLHQHTAIFFFSNSSRWKRSSHWRRDHLLFQGRLPRSLLRYTWSTFKNFVKLLTDLAVFQITLKLRETMKNFEVWLELSKSL